ENQIHECSGLNVIKNKKSALDYTKEKIEENLNLLKDELNELRENIRCALHISVASKCNEFIKNFNKCSGEIWNNPMFATSTFCNEQNEGTYITDVVSLASKAYRNIEASKGWMRKKPDVMALEKYKE
ncbi:15677_t:CDS:2, partial [Cetraspora pellucida]